MPELALRPGVLENLKRTSGIASDSAMAGAIGVSRETYIRVKSGQAPPSARFIAGLAAAFDLDVGTIATVVISPSRAAS